MKTHRPLRLGSLIREELGKLLLREMEFDGALVTITEVEVDKKIDHAKVLVSILPFTKAEVILSQLIRAQGHLQHKLNHILNIRPMPRIAFALDEGPIKSSAIEYTVLQNKEAFEKEAKDQ